MRGTGKPRGRGAPALPPPTPRPRGHRLLRANKPQAEAQLVTGVSRLPQPPRGRNMVSPGTSPSVAGTGMGGWPGRAPSAGRVPPSTRDMSFGVLSQAQSEVPPNPLVFPGCGADSSPPQTHTAGRASGEGTPGPEHRGGGGVQRGPPGACCPPSSPAPPRPAPGMGRAAFRVPALRCQHP